MDRPRTPEPRSGDSGSLTPPGSSDTPGTRGIPLWAKRVSWKLQGKSGRTIGWRIKLEKARYTVGVAAAKRLCRGNKYGVHTPSWQPLGGQCLCSRVRRRLDYIPF